MPTYGGDEVNAIVIDIGSDWTRAGYAGEDSPYTYFPTNVGYIPGSNDSSNSENNREEEADKNKENQYSGMEMNVDEGTEGKEAHNPSTEEDDDRVKQQETGIAEKKKNTCKYFVGNMGVEVFRPNMEVQSVLSGGLVENWDAYEEIIDYSINDCLRVSSEEHPMLFSEANWNTPEKREKLTELVFEKYKVPGFYVSKSAALSAFGTGKSTALVVDSGSDVTSVVPVYDGYVLQKGIVKQNIGGDFISSLIETSLKKNFDYEITPLFEVKSKQIVDTAMKPKFERRVLDGVTGSYRREMRKKCLLELKENVYQVLNAPFDDETATTFGTRPFEFPDGFNVAIGSERFYQPEVMFQPQMFESAKNLVENGEPLSIQEMAQLSVSKCDVDLRPHLLHNVVLSGGNTLFPGFTERFSNELPKMCPSSRVRIHTPGSAMDRKYTAWLGGSILASLGTFHQMWISSEDYKEYGSSVVNKRCY